MNTLNIQYKHCKYNLKGTDTYFTVSTNIAQKILHHCQLYPMFAVFRSLPSAMTVLCFPGLIDHVSSSLHCHIHCHLTFCAS